MGFDHFVGNLYWLRAVQYAGGHAGGFEFDALPEYIDLVTDLDPHFEAAYRFGALVYPLNENIQNRVPDLLNKGIEMNKGRNQEFVAQLYIDLGFYTYFFENKYEEAADIYATCRNEIPECPPFAVRVEGFLRNKAGRHEIALNTWLDRLSKIVQQPESVSTEETELFKQKIEESAKLVALTCAAEQYAKRNSEPLTEIDQLLDIKVNDCTPLQELNAQYRAVLEYIVPSNDLQVITSNTLQNSFDHNPFLWDAEKNQVTTFFWKDYETKFDD